MAGIEESEYQELENRVDLLDDLSLVHLNQHQKVLLIRNLPGMSETVWKHYEINELEGMKEMMLLKNALVQLKLAIKEIISNGRKSK